MTNSTGRYAELCRRGIYLAVPAYDGTLQAGLATALIGLTTICNAEGIPISVNILSGHALLPEVRNVAVSEFLACDFQLFVFVDSDIVFEPADLVRMVDRQLSDQSYSVVSGVYVRKTIDWNSVSHIASGLGRDVDAAALAAAGSTSYVHHPPQDLTGDDFLKVDYVGTGYLAIRREVFERMMAEQPWRVLAHQLKAWHDWTTDVYSFFDIGNETMTAAALAQDIVAMISEGGASIEQVKERAAQELKANSYRNSFVAEDFLFCQRVRALGMSIWLAPWARSTHVGTYAFAS